MNFELCDEECKLVSLRMHQGNHRKEGIIGTDEQLAQTLEQIDCLQTRLSFLETEYEKLQLELKQSNYKLDDVTDKYYELRADFDEVNETY
ncbi:MAG: hypothetical protein IM613_12175 [Cytophagales bacterium]|nr:hypothetical protein [Cytophagales bacterium]